MIQAVSDLNQKYGGLIALSGLGLAVVSIAVAVFFYYNPRRPKLRLAYKLFFPDVGFARIGRIIAEWRNKDPGITYRYFVDIWNGGKEPLKDDMIRGKFLITTAKEEQRHLILSGEIDQETHPSISGFQATKDQDGLAISWRHFDPGMAVRVRMELAESIPLQGIVFTGSGLGLEIRRARTLSERGGVVELIRAILVGGVPIFAGSIFVGYLIRWFQVVKFNAAISTILAIPILFAALILFSLIVSFGVFVNYTIETLFNLKTPIERSLGPPTVDQTIAAAASRAYIDQLPADELHRMIELSETRSAEQNLRSFPIAIPKPSPGPNGPDESNT